MNQENDFLIYSNRWWTARFLTASNVTCADYREFIRKVTEHGSVF